MPTRGKVKWFDPKKGYGFIVGPEGQDVFVHYSQIQGDGFRSLKDGEDVEYELIEGDKGWQARLVLKAVSVLEPGSGSNKVDSVSGTSA
jgi:CspA family cold shock protein